MRHSLTYTWNPCSSHGICNVLSIPSNRQISNTTSPPWPITRIKIATNPSFKYTPRHKTSEVFTVVVGHVMILMMIRPSKFYLDHINLRTSS
ncbi:hypothetical protein Syun_006272 [Stephania yunnanensis]|uniref:Uncharacterized protein n=1 Tax=Stephania yunnanensis TaxID=152371 RepID=A0AAP0KWL3_9MAGN